MSGIRKPGSAHPVTNTRQRPGRAIVRGVCVAMPCGSVSGERWFRWGELVRGGVWCALGIRPTSTERDFFKEEDHDQGNGRDRDTHQEDVVDGMAVSVEDEVLHLVRERLDGIDIIGIGT